MPIWEYKIITSGSLGFASPQLLEQHLNQLGKEEWEIIHFQTRPENPLAFSGLARRPVMRDWVVEPAAAAAPGLRSSAVPAPPEEKTVTAPSVRELRAEAEERRESLLAREESLRPLRDDSAADEDERPEAADYDAFDEEELPTFFEAIRPHMRRNLRGAGMAVSIEFLAKKFGQTEADLITALKECGFTIPTDPTDQTAQIEYDGDLYWLNLNSRRQLWINTREKPRAAFRVTPGRKVTADETPDDGSRMLAEAGKEPDEQRPAPAETASGESLPAGPALLDRLRPLMRRNRRDTGLSGSITYLARAMKIRPPVLEDAFATLGLAMPAGANDQPVFAEIGSFVYWLNRDKNGQIWINSRAKERTGEPGPAAGGAPTPAELVAALAAAPQAELPLAAPAGGHDEEHRAPARASPLAAVRLLLKETKRGGVAAEVGNLAKQLHKSTEELEAALVAAGLKVPEKPREKPVFSEHAGEIFWLNRNARGELWLNAKASKFADQVVGEKESAETPATTRSSAGHRPRRPRTRGDNPRSGDPGSPPHC